MAESLAFSKTSDRRLIYEEILPQIDSLISHEPDQTANFANVAAVLKQAFGFFWVGFYLKKGEQLVLGPFQGPIACTRIDLGSGVCGHAYSTAAPVIVPNVDEFPGHIACASESKSEIVVPIFNHSREVIGVLDVDSDRLDDFSDIDREGLARIVRVIERVIQSHTNSDKNE